MTDFLMTSTEAQQYIDASPATCTVCGGIALFGIKGPMTMCCRCLFCCRRCGVFLPLDSEYHYCDDCGEAMHYDAWDKVQP